MNWISVNDKMPEFTNIFEDESTSNDVLVVTEGDSYYVAYLIFYPARGYRKEPKTYWLEQGSGCGCCCCCSSLHVKYWMPLPSFPENNHVGD